MMRVALAVFFALLVATPAQAATKVTWPAQRAYAPGERVAVTVKADRKVRVAVLRVSARGKVMGSVVRRTVKRATVRATLPRAGTYAVRVGRRQRALKVVAPAPTPSPAPPAAPAPPVAEPCVDEATTVSVEVTLGADRVQRGQSLPYSITNTSDGCILTGLYYVLEHQQADGTWAPAPWETAFPAVGIVVAQGAVFAKSAWIPADAPLGIYRLIELGGFTEPTFEVVP